MHGIMAILLESKANGRGQPSVPFHPSQGRFSYRLEEEEEEEKEDGAAGASL